MTPTFPPYRCIRVEPRAEGAEHWLYMHTDPNHRPCFRESLLDEVNDAFERLGAQEPASAWGELHHFVIASDGPAFNLGGDLEHFGQLIRSQDRAQLLSYAYRCVRGAKHLYGGGSGNTRSIALVQGDALGGGLEMALACTRIVAEEGAMMGLPEVLFGLFPGMGAYSFLRQRVAPQVAEKIILGGTMFRAEDLHAMGVVDVLAPKGEGEAAVRSMIRDERKAPQAFLAMNRIRQATLPDLEDELRRITEVWVEAALALGDRGLKTMDRLVKAQYRRIDRESGGSA